MPSGEGLAVFNSENVRRFLDAAEVFFSNLAAIDWVAMAAALGFYLAHLLARSQAWRNVLRAAYPKGEIRYRSIAGAYLIGAGLNGIIPARVGDIVKIYLAKQAIRGSSYPAITSSFAVQTVFDTTAGVLVLGFAITQGLLPRPPELPDLPAFDVSFWAQNPQLLILTLTVLGVAMLTAFALLARHAERFWERVKQGVVVLTDWRLYLRSVASWQAIAWVLRFFALFFFLEAFNIGGSFSNVMLVMSVIAVSTILPFTPGGAGAQQALLVATLEGAPRGAILAYSAGQQLAITAWTAGIGFATLMLIFRTTDWRSVVRSAEADVEQHRARQAAGEG